MGKLEFNGCKLKVQLEAQSPIIHFQHDQAGATLRASEVKPKLDRFLLNKMEQETGKRVTVLKEDNGYAVMFTDKEHNALNYRMNFEVPGNAYWVEPGTFKPESYSIYYGNSGVHDEKEKKKAVFTNPVMNLMCFNQVLRNYIEKYLVEFFAVTNFGTMQDKGFGSFMPKECLKKSGELTLEETKRFAEMLKQAAGSVHCYSMSFVRVPEEINAKNAWCTKVFKQIKDFYGIMKSGQNFGGYSRSYLFQYMHGTDNKGNRDDLSIDNEKAWLKQKGIVPIIEKNGKTDRVDKNPRYVRALLGVGAGMSFIQKDGKRLKVKINHKKGDGDAIERMDSPVKFKIIRNKVFITAEEVPEEIYGRMFEFQNKERNWDGNKRGSLMTPSKEDFKDGKFDIQTFLACYVNYYNSRKLRKDKLPSIAGNVEVQEVK
ncbi:MAG: hypothetical protein ACLVDG_07100 [Coprococcus sp.]